MGSIFVQGIGEVQIEGDTPTAEEQNAIAGAYSEPKGKERINSRMKLAGESFKQGFADLASLPGYLVDMVNYPLHKLGITPEEAFGSAEQIRRGVDWMLQTQDLPPEDESDKYIQSISRFAGAGALPGATVVGGAAQKGLAAATELSSTILGGGGAVIGGDIAEQLGIPREHGEMILGAIGGITPVATQGTMQKGLAKGKQLLTRENQEAFARNQAREELEGAIATDVRAQDNIARSQQLMDEIPGFEPMLPQAVGTPGIVAVGKRVAERTPENLNKVRVRMDQNIDAIQNKFETDFPEAAIDALSPARETLKQTENMLASGLEKAKLEQVELASSYARSNAPEIGEKLRLLRSDAKKSAMTIKDSKYLDAYEAANNQGVAVRVDDIYDDVSSLIKADEAAFQGGEMPFVFRQITSKYKPDTVEDLALIMPDGSKRLIKTNDPINVGFPEFHSLIRQTNQEINAANKAGNYTKEYYLIKLKNKLEGKLSPYMKEGEFGEKLTEAERFWRDDYNAVFRKGVGGKIDKYNQFGHITPDERIVSDLVFKSKGSIEQFRKIYKDTPEANEILIDGILDLYSKAAVRDGKIKPTLSKTFIRNNKSVLDEIPEVRDMLLSSDKANDLLITRQGDIVRKQSSLAKSALARIGKIDNVDSAIESALKSPKQMFALMGSARRTQEGRLALARAVADHVKSKPNPYQYILKHEKILSTAMNPLGKGHMKNLKIIAEAEEVLARAKPPTSIEVTKTIQDPLEKRIGTTVKSVISQLRAAAQGRVSQQYVFSDISGKFLFKIQQNEAEKLLDAAIFDADIAKTIAGLGKRDIISPAQANKIKHHLYSLGIRSVAATQPTEEK